MNPLYLVVELAPIFLARVQTLNVLKLSTRSKPHDHDQERAARTTRNGVEQRALRLSCLGQTSARLPLGREQFSRITAFGQLVIYEIGGMKVYFW